MWVNVSIDNAECVLAARGKQKVMAANVISNYFEQSIASVRINQIAGREENFARVIERSARRNYLGDVALSKRQQVGDLFTQRVGNRKNITFVESERDT